MKKMIYLAVIAFVLVVFNSMNLKAVDVPEPIYAQIALGNWKILNNAEGCACSTVIYTENGHTYATTVGGCSGTGACFMVGSDGSLWVQIPDSGSLSITYSNSEPAPSSFIESKAKNQDELLNNNNVSSNNNSVEIK